MRRKRSRSPSSAPSSSSSYTSSRSFSPPPSHAFFPSRSRSPSSRPSSPVGKRRVRWVRGSCEREQRSEGTRVHVGSLAMETSPKELTQRFRRFGAVLDLWKAWTQPCFAFVVFRRRQDAVRAIKSMDGELLHNRRMRVTLARPRTKGTRSGGAFNPYLRCYQCGKMGHFSRVCRAHNNMSSTAHRAEAKFRSHRGMKEKPEARYTGNYRHARQLSSSGSANHRKF